MMHYLLSKNRAEQFRMFVVVVCATLATLVPIHLFREIIDRAIPERDSGLLFMLSGALLAVLLIGAWLEYLKAVLARRIQEFFVSDMRLSLMSHIMDLPSEYFSAHPVGKLINRIMHDVSRFGMGIEWLLVNPVIAVATIVLYSGYLLSIDVMLTVLAVLPLPLVVFVTTKISRVLSIHRSTVMEAAGTYSASVNEIMLAAMEVQSNGTYRRERERLLADHAALSSAGIKEAALLARISATSGMYREVVPIMIYCYGGWLALSGDLSVGRVVAFAAAFGGLYYAIDTLINYMPFYQNVRDRYAELQKILQTPRIGPATSASAAPVATPGAELALREVSFSHLSGARIINRLNMEIRPGEHIALIGRSGCGKSTLLNLIAGRLQPESGQIRYGDVTHDMLDSVGRVGLISYVQQSPFLFAGSVRSNLLYGVSDDANAHTFQDEDLLQACINAGLEIDMLNFGLEACIAAEDASPFLHIRADMAKKLLTHAHDTAEPTIWDSTQSIRVNLIPAGCDMDDAGVARRVAELIIAALANAGISKQISVLGLNFDVGERGSRLSGGQRQKVSIVRALMRKRPILLLDEVTASLDESSARTVLKLLQKDLRNVTVIAITHELDTLKDFDRVIALKDGAIVADADPASIMNDAALLASVLERKQMELP